MNSNKKNKKINDLKKQLEQFLKNNSYSEVELRNEIYYINNPWEDESLSFEIKKEDESELIKTLNNLILPPRFSAIYHLDTKEIEYIYNLINKNSIILIVVSNLH